MMTWRYYNYAMMPSTAPHKSADIEPVNNGTIWRMGEGKALLARWTSDFDCGYETEWWYVIKDMPFDISSLKSKRRYEINKGKKNFEVKRIVAAEYPEELFEVQVAAFSGWPEKYRPTVNKENFCMGLRTWDKYIVYGGFERETGKLVAYAQLSEHAEYLDFSVLRANPNYERNGINAAMVAAIVENYNGRLSDGFYICDGERSIRHETAFQDYLEKYFGFRKAYCRLNIKYRCPFGLVVKVMYPMRHRIKSDSRIGSMSCAILRMEEIRRSYI